MESAMEREVEGKYGKRKELILSALPECHLSNKQHNYFTIASFTMLSFSSAKS